MTRIACCALALALVACTPTPESEQGSATETTGSEASVATETTGGETSVATETTGGETSVVEADATTPTHEGSVEGSPECAGCVYSSSPGHVGPSGGGGIAEWCLASGDDPRQCPMSCCRSAR